MPKPGRDRVRPIRSRRDHEEKGHRPECGDGTARHDLSFALADLDDPWLTGEKDGGENKRNVLPSFRQNSAKWGRIALVDALDRQILAELQQDGRLTVTELAERIGLSLSPCHRRLRAWNAPAPSAATTHTSTPTTWPDLRGSGVFATMSGGDRDTVDAFEQAVAAIPNVREAQRLFGEPDYLLRVITADLAAFQELYDRAFSPFPVSNTSAPPS